MVRGCRTLEPGRCQTARSHCNGKAFRLPVGLLDLPHNRRLDGPDIALKKNNTYSLLGDVQFVGEDAQDDPKRS